MVYVDERLYISTAISRSVGTRIPLSSIRGNVAHANTGVVAAVATVEQVHRHTQFAGAAERSRRAQELTRTQAGPLRIQGRLTDVARIQPVVGSGLEDGCRTVRV
jgi:hypothetical protein